MEQTYAEFLKDLASKSPAPGGGGASALVGAVGTALGHMVCELTVGKQKYADVENEIKEQMKHCKKLQEEILKQISADEKAFLPLAEAYKIPKDDPKREKTMEKALENATRVPLRIMELCCDSADAVSVIAEKGSRMAVSDAGCAASCIRAALQSAYFNVLINVKAMKDTEKAKAIDDYASGMLGRYTEICDGVVENVINELKKEKE